MKNRVSKIMNCAVVAAALAAFGAAAPAQAGKGNSGNPGILPPHSHPHGKTYGEWAVAWWQWVLSIPADPITLSEEINATYHLTVAAPLQ